MRHGLDATTGRPLDGWAHCVQSIRTILTTRVGSRVMRRDFGAALRELQDRTPSPRVIMRAYATIADALARWEPGYRLRRIRLVRGAADGIYRFELEGEFYPRGHLGDYSTRETRVAALGVGELARGISA